MTEEFAGRLEELLDVNQLDYQDETTKKWNRGLPLIRRNDRNGKVREYTPKGSNVKVPIELTMYGWWAREFYGARSKVVHEGVVDRDDLVNHNNAPHFNIAIAVLNFCLYRLLESKGYLVYEKSDVAGFEDSDKILTELDLREIEEKLQ